MSEYEDTCPDCLREAEKEDQPMSHTPEPWKWTQPYVRLVSENGDDVLTSGDDGIYLTTEENACLIAAAPALLAALKEVMVDYRQCGMQDRQVMTVVKDALQHAEGKE